MFSRSRSWRSKDWLPWAAACAAAAASKDESKEERIRDSKALRVVRASWDSLLARFRVAWGVAAAAAADAAAAAAEEEEEETLALILRTEAST